MLLTTVDQLCPTLQTHERQPARLLCPWNFPAKNTGLSCRFLLQGIFLNQGSNLHLLYWLEDSLPPSHLGSPLTLLALLKQKSHIPVACYHKADVKAPVYFFSDSYLVMRHHTLTLINDHGKDSCSIAPSEIPAPGTDSTYMVPTLLSTFFPRSTSSGTLAQVIVLVFLPNLISFFLKNLLYFTLQYCIGFAIHQYESTTGVL